MKSKFLKYIPLIIVLCIAAEIFFTYLFLHLIKTVLHVPFGTIYYKFGSIFLLAFLIGILLAVIIDWIVISKTIKRHKRFWSMTSTILFQSTLFIGIYFFERCMRELMLLDLMIPPIEVFELSILSLRNITPLITLSYLIGVIGTYIICKIKNPELYKQNSI